MGAKKIPLNGKYAKGRFTLVDSDVYEWAKDYSWHVTMEGYAAAPFRQADGKYKIKKLHILVNETPPDKVTDHINGDSLDNRRENLRTATRAQNCHNSKPRPGGSKFKGVSPRGSSWRATIMANGKRHHLGFFSSEMDAARAYDQAATFYHGEFARLNLGGIN
jgi:hypothetical protein